jgi:hypothetical protein
VRQLSEKTLTAADLIDHQPVDQSQRQVGGARDLDVTPTGESIGPELAAGDTLIVVQTALIIRL